ncbi:MAG: SDR family oxidoreductase [Terrimicrobiaceae bacterium]
MNFSLQGKTAFVTGSSRGIGRSIAIALAEAGASVVVHGVRREAAAEETIQKVAATGAMARWVEGDLAAEGGRGLGERVLEACGGVDILVLNASIQKKAVWSGITAEDSERQFRANFQASLELIQVLAPSMQRKKWGRILAIGSVQQARPHPEMLAYAASKAAQMSMVLNLARQLAPDGITVNNLAPGVILTDRNAEALADPGYSEKVLRSIPAGFFGEPEDCAGPALLLCSEAGRYITGQNLYVDGGSEH